MRRRVLGSVIAVGAALTLAACAPPTLPEFERPQTDEDHPSAIVATDANVHVESIRRAGDVDGVEIFLARGTASDDQLCVLLVRDDVWESTSCGGQLGVGIEAPDGTRIEVGSYTFPVDADRTSVSESVRVLADG